MSETTFDPNSKTLLDQVQREVVLSALVNYLATEAEGYLKGNCRRMVTQLSREAQNQAWLASHGGPDQAKHEAAAENLNAAIAWLNEPGKDAGDFVPLIWSVLGKK